MALPLIGGLLAGLAPKVVEAVQDLVSQYVEDKDKANELAHALSGKVLDILGVELTVKGGIIKAEAESEHPLTSQWRPITMLVFVAIIANNYLLYPYLSLFWGDAPVLDIPDPMWELLKIGLGGYIVSRGVEKVVRDWKGGSQ